MRKLWKTFLFALLLTLACAGGKVQAATIIDSGSCGVDGDEIIWTLDSEGTLRFTGYGQMEDYGGSTETGAPWRPQRSKITACIVEEGITGIGKYAFDNEKNLLGIFLPKSLVNINASAFNQCLALKHIYYGGNSRSWQGVTGKDKINDSKNNVIHYDMTVDQLLRLRIEKPKSGTLTADAVLAEKGQEITVTSLSALGYGLVNIYQNGQAIEGKKFTMEEDTLLTAEYQRMKPELTAVDGGNCGENVEWIYYENGLLYIFGKGPMKMWHDQNDVESYTSSPWYKHKTENTKVIIEDGVTTIGSGAFYEHSNLTEVSIPDSVTLIGNFVFGKCSSLANIDIPDSVTEILGAMTFTETAIREIVLPEGMSKIESHCFTNCANLEKVVLPSTITDIRQNAFEKCVKLKEIDIPDDVWRIDIFAFNRCSSLERVKLPAHLQIIADNAFKECTKLTSLKIPESVTSIGKNAFYRCSAMKNMDLRGQITELKEGVFQYCTVLDNLYLPESLKTIGKNAFYGCVSLYDIYFYGEQAQWDKITIDASNDDILSEVTIHPLKGMLNDLSTCTLTLSQSTFTYNGTARKPNVYVKKDGVKLSKNEDFTINYENNVEVGTAIVTVTGTGLYSGSLQASYIIRPMATSLISVSNPVNRNLEITWNPAQDVDGYEVKYSTCSDFSDASTRQLQGQENCYLKLTGRTVGKRYYVRVRTYKRVDGEKYYSLWSEYKSAYLVPPVKVLSAECTNLSVKMEWEENALVEGYELVIAKDADYRKVVKKYTLDAAETALEWTSSSGNEGRYYARIRAFVKDGDGSVLYSVWKQ